MRKHYWLMIGLGAVALLAQGLMVPYWGDDYVFLLAAEQARVDGTAWWQLLWPETADKFWRPLGEELYWLFVAKALSGNPVLAHLANLLLLLGASAAVGFFVQSLIAVKWPELNAHRAGYFAAVFYLLHAAHFLPLVWAAAANSTIVVLLSATTLACWVRGYGSGKKAWLALALVAYVLALGSKEIAIVLPSLATIVSLWLWPVRVPNRGVWIAGVSGVAITIAWLVARSQAVVVDEPAYAMTIGGNVIKNAISLGAFSLNVPREALRFAVADRSLLAMAWGVVCALLQGAALTLLLAAAARRLQPRSLLALAAFAVVACAPYFLLTGNLYAYYLGVALIGYSVLVGLASVDHNKLRLAAGFAVISALISTAGNHFLPSPGLLAKARWGEQNLRKLEALHDQARLPQPLRVMVGDEQQFYAIGLAGVAYRLQIRLHQLLSSPDCTDLDAVAFIRFADEPIVDECPALQR